MSANSHKRTFGKKGWAIAPMVADLLADWALEGRRPGLLQPFSYDRFGG